MAAKQTPGGGLEVFKRDAAGKMTSFAKISPEDSLTTHFVGFDVAGTTLYALDSRGRDKAALVTIDVNTGAPNRSAMTRRGLRWRLREGPGMCPVSRKRRPRPRNRACWHIRKRSRSKGVVGEEGSIYAADARSGGNDCGIR